MSLIRLIQFRPIPLPATLHVLLVLIVSFGAVAVGQFSGEPCQPAVPQRWVAVPGLPAELMLLDSVFWEPLDTESLRKLIRDEPKLVAGKSVMEIGTGSGLIALCCREAGAQRVTATDINPHAIRCAKANAVLLGRANIDFRLVASKQNADSSAFAVIEPHEKFDVIISNPPWEDDLPNQWKDYALYDPNFALLRSILVQFQQHLNPGGRLMLAYGCVDAIRAAQGIAAELNLEVLILDDRDPEDLPHVFLPGMLLGIMPKP